MDTRFKISYHQKRTPPRYTKLEELVKPFAKDAAFRWSYKGVPHLLVELGRGVVYSLCYFRGQKLWRVFYPYGGSQQKQDFGSIDELVKFLRKHRPIRLLKEEGKRKREEDNEL